MKLNLILIQHEDGSMSCPTGKNVTWWVNYGWYEAIQREERDSYLKTVVSLLQAGF